MQGSTQHLADLRMMISLRPGLLYAEAHELSRLLQCSPEAAEEARRFIVENALEVAE
jgi:hypothetical protein